MIEKPHVVRVYISVDVELYNCDNNAEAENRALEIVADDLKGSYMNYDIGIAEVQK